jgi:hypothetical protein
MVMSPTALLIVLNQSHRHAVRIQSGDVAARLFTALSDVAMSPLGSVTVLSGDVAALI